MLSVSEAQKRATAKYVKSHYGQVCVRWPIEFVKRLKASAKNSDESLAEYIRKSIESRMDEGINN